MIIRAIDAKLKKTPLQTSPPRGYPLPGSFLTFARVFTHAFITLIPSSLILNKNLILAIRLKANLSSMFDTSVSNRLTK